VRFTKIKDGITLGVKLDTEGVDASEADFPAQTGRVKFSGTLVLDYVPFRCIAEMHLQSMMGFGRLEGLSA
jgi:hypothetical protein